MATLPSKIKQANVAGSFYSESAATLKASVSRFLEKAPLDIEKAPKALIAPHAGYIYSGAIAATAYKSLEKVADKVKRVVLLGPSHYYPLDKITLADFDYYSIPGAELKIDHSFDGALLGFDYVQVQGAAFEKEHSLEVHLPFLQHMLKDFTLLPILLGRSSFSEIASILNLLWGGDETLVVVSSDLSHFLSYTEAQQVDLQTAKAITNLNVTHLKAESACGLTPIGGLLHVARSKGLEGHMVDLRNSGDTAGDKQRVVGYGSFLFFEKVAAI